METKPTFKSRIKDIAAYSATAVLLIVLTVLSRVIDSVFFESSAPLKPAEMTTETFIILFAAIYVIKYRGTELLIKIRKYLIFAGIPLVLIFVSFFYIPDKVMSGSMNFIHILDVFLSAVSDDLVLCAVGCILLVHNSRLRISGMIIMILSMALHTAILTDDTATVVLYSVAAVVMTGFFEIQLHLNAESMIFCAAYHFLIHLCMELPVKNSEQGSPLIGRPASGIVYLVALLTMTAFGVVLIIKRKKEENKIPENIKTD